MIFWLASYPKSGNTWVRMFWRSYFLPSNQVFSLNKRGNLDLEVFNFPTANQLKEANVDHTDFRNIAKNWIFGASATRSTFEGVWEDSCCCCCNSYF